MALDRTAIAEVANSYGLDAFIIMALTEVESAGTLFWPIKKADGSVTEKAPIRWEGHYFYKLLSGDTLDLAVKNGLASSKAGAIKNPASGQGRYDMLARAMRIDASAALQSISMGAGQVMGANYKALGFNNVVDMFKVCQTGLKGQVELICKFITASPALTRAVNGKNFNVIAKIYNGPAWKRNNYGQKLKDAYLKFSGRLDEPDILKELNTGAAGGWLAELRKLGYTDVKIFQSENNLVADGIIGPATIEAIQKKLQTKEVEKWSFTKWFSKIVSGGAAGLIALITGAASNAKDASDALGPIKDVLGGLSPYGGYIASGLGVVLVGAVVTVYVINQKTAAS